MLKSIKSVSDSGVAKIAQFLPRFNPNFITIVGLVPSLLFFWLITNYYFGWAMLALAATILDSLDGAYARATGQQTKYGAFLDSNLDRLSDSIIITAFGFALVVSWELVIATLVTSFLISYARSNGSSLLGESKNLAIGPIERASRIIVIFLSLLAYTFWPNTYWLEYNVIEIGFIVLLALSIITVIRRFRAVKRLAK